jgi:hypothetical protein
VGFLAGFFWHFRRASRRRQHPRQTYAKPQKAASLRCCGRTNSSRRGPNLSVKNRPMLSVLSGIDVPTDVCPRTPWAPKRPAGTLRDDVCRRTTDRQAHTRAAAVARHRTDSATIAETAGAPAAAQTHGHDQQLAGS